MKDILFFIAYTLGSLFDPILIIICGIFGVLIRSYLGALTLAIIIFLPLNLVLLSSAQSDPPPVFFLAKPVAAAIWVAAFWFIAQKWRGREKEAEQISDGNAEKPSGVEREP